MIVARVVVAWFAAINLIVEFGNVAGVEPEVAATLQSCFGHAEILIRHRPRFTATHQQFSSFTGRQMDAIVISYGDFEFR